jgi:hypothetical protein
VDLRAAPPSPKPAAARASESIPALDPTLSAFMEKAALAHVATPRPEVAAAPMSRPVSPAPEILAAAQHRSRSAIASSAAPKDRDRPAAPLTLASAPVSPLVAAAPDRVSRPLPIIPAPPVVRAHLASPPIAELRHEPPAPLDESLRPPADLAPRAPDRPHRFASRVDDVVHAPMRLVSGVADVGQSIGHSIGSFLHRF